MATDDHPAITPEHHARAAAAGKAPTTASQLAWAVRFWWREGGHLVETGGHFMWHDGDTPRKVLDSVAAGRGVDIDACVEISIVLLGGG